MAHEAELIEYLSKEIETHTNNLMTFRARINLWCMLMAGEIGEAKGAR